MFADATSTLTVPSVYFSWASRGSAWEDKVAGNGETCADVACGWFHIISHFNQHNKEPLCRGDTTQRADSKQNDPNRLWNQNQIGSDWLQLGWRAVCVGGGVWGDAHQSCVSICILQSARPSFSKQSFEGPSIRPPSKQMERPSLNNISWLLLANPTNLVFIFKYL